jgi:hypothetical protein
VKNGEGTISSRYGFDGVEILAVLPSSPAAAAGVHGERQQAHAALRLGLLAASIFFPPAMLDVAVLGSSGPGKSQELTIAVDGVRIYDVSDFGAALDQVQPGEVVYPTIRWRAAQALPNVRHFIRDPSPVTG